MIKMGRKEYWGCELKVWQQANGYSQIRAAHALNVSPRKYQRMVTDESPTPKDIQLRAGLVMCLQAAE